MNATGIARQLFGLSPSIRYVAVSRNHRVVETAQNPEWPSRNPAETDRLMDLIVNPFVFELAQRRDELDLSGVRFGIVRHGPLYQLLLPYGDGLLSIGVDPDADVIRIAEEVETRLNLSSRAQGPL